MPIHPTMKGFFPPDRGETSQRIRFQRPQVHCEWCGVAFCCGDCSKSAMSFSWLTTSSSTAPHSAPVSRVSGSAGETPALPGDDPKIGLHP